MRFSVLWKWYNLTNFWVRKAGFFADSLKPRLSFYLNWRLGMFSSKLLNLVDAYRNSTSGHCNRLYRGRPLICYTIEKEINTIFLFWITACDKFLIRNCLTYLRVFFWLASGFVSQRERSRPAVLIRSSLSCNVTYLHSWIESADYEAWVRVT